MRKIPIGASGKSALVDNENYARLTTHAWYLTNKGYASNRGGMMHRIVINAPKHLQVDHINGNRLDNRIENLRLATQSQNQRNASPRPNGTSKYKGVHWCKTNKKWRAGIWLGKRINLGRFDIEIDAAKAYDKAAKKHFGAFARTNF